MMFNHAVHNQQILTEDVCTFQEERLHYNNQHISLENFVILINLLESFFLRKRYRLLILHNVLQIID